MDRHWSGSCTGFCDEMYVFVSPKMFRNVLNVLGMGPLAAE